MSSDSAPLTCFRAGEHARIEWLGTTEEDAQRLRELGLREGCRVCVMANADKCILGLAECRIALQREVAQQLFATPA